MGKPTLKRAREEKAAKKAIASRGRAPVWRAGQREGAPGPNHARIGPAPPWEEVLLRGAPGAPPAAAIEAPVAEVPVVQVVAPEPAAEEPVAIEAPIEEELDVAEEAAVEEVVEVAPAKVEEGAAAIAPLEPAAAPEPAAGGVTETRVMARRTGTGAPLDPGACAIALSEILIRSRGEPLSAPLSGRMASAFGRDLSHVRAHTDPAAAAAARALDADAFTLRNHIFFGAGRFSPGTPSGDRLLAHELCHVVQHDEGRIPAASSPSGLTVSSPSDALEREAEATVDEVLAGVPQEAATAGAAPASVPAALSSSPLVVSRKATDTAKELLGKGYFQQAAGWGTLGGDLSGALSTDQADLVAGMPPVQEKMGPEPPVAPAIGEVAPPAGEVSLDEVVTGADPGPPVFAETGAGEAPAAPGVPRLTPGEGGDTTDMERRYESALQDVPTTAPDVATSPGPPPEITLGGESDPSRADTQRESAVAQAEQLGQSASEAVDASPGPERIAPRTVSEEHPVPAPEVAAGAEAEGLGEIPRMQELQALGLPQEVQDTTDELGRDQLTASTQQATAGLDQAQTDADAQREKAVTDAETQNQELLDKANQDQEAEVKKARKDITKGQEDTKQKQREAAGEVGTKSETEKATLKSDVEARIQDDQSSIDGELKNAEEKAEKEKAGAEREAAKKKADAESASEDESWWDRAISAISAAFDALASAVTELFDALVAAVTEIIDAAKRFATEIIDKARDWVISQLKEFGDFLKDLVNALLADLFPELARALNELIDAAVDLAVEAVNAIADALKAGVLALLDAIGGWIKAILAAYRAAILAALALARAALTGDWEALGKMILESVLKLAGIPPEDFYGLIARAMGAIDQIIADPGGFVGHVIDAVAKGFGQFADNILEHLKQGFFEWLVGPLGELGITLPKSWDFAGIFGLVMDVLGLNKPGIQQIIVEEFGETAGKVFDFVWKYVSALIEGGWEGVWEQIKNDLGSLWDMVVEGIKGYLIETIVKQAVIKIASMFNPAGAILQAIITVWNVYNWLRQNAQRIWGVVTSIVDMIASIAAGDIDPAAKAVESTLASLVPIAISLLANILGLGGITEKVKETIDGVRGYVRGAIKSLIQRVKALFKGAKDEEEEEDDKKPDDVGDGEVGETIPFGAHRLWLTVAGATVTVMVASGAKPVSDYLDEWQRRLDDNEELLGENRSKAIEHIGAARSQDGVVKKEGDEAAQAKKVTNGKKDDPAATAALEKQDGDAELAEKRLADLLATLFELFELFGEYPGPVAGKHPVPDPVLPKGTRESHHVPAFALAGAIGEELGEAAAKVKSSHPDNPAAAALATELEGRKTKIIEIPGRGDGLSAILLHKDSHKRAHAAAPAPGAKKAIMTLLTEKEQEANKTRVRVLTATGKKLSVKPQGKTWRRFLNECMWVVERAREVEPPEKIRESEALVETTRAQMLELEKEEKAKVVPTILEETAEFLRKAVDDAYAQGKAATAGALAGSKSDGTDKEKSDALKELDNFKDTWAFIFGPF